MSGKIYANAKVNMKRGLQVKDKSRDNYMFVVCWLFKLSVLQLCSLDRAKQSVLS